MEELCSRRCSDGRSVRRVLRQAWELDDADKAERLLRNLAQRLERDWSGVAGSILEGIDEIVTVTRLRLPKELRRSLACTNIIENVMSTVRRVCRNVKRWRSASMAMRWTAAAMQEAAKGFRRLKAHKQLPALRAALQAHQNKTHTASLLAKPTPLNINPGSDRFSMFNKKRDIVTQGRDLSTLAPLWALRARTPGPAWTRRAVGEGVKFCPRAGCGRSACPVR